MSVKLGVECGVVWCGVGYAHIDKMVDGGFPLAGRLWWC